jgi:hypothetical protein
MKILIDTGHPAEIHFFKSIASLLEKNGHSVYFAIREKDCSVKIAKTYNLKYTIKGKGSYSLLLKPIYFFRAIYKLVKLTKKNNPDIIVSFASPYAGIVARLFNKPHIIFVDTEHKHLLKWLDKTFSSHIITPSCFQKNMGPKHIHINTYKELAYLSPAYFSIKPGKINDLKLPSKAYILVRLVNHGAAHDTFKKKWNNSNKFHFVHKLAQSYPLIISSEIALPSNLKKYSYTFPPHMLHQIIAHAKMVVGESATVATESAVLGVPSVYMDYSNLGYVNEIEHDYRLIKQYKPEPAELEKAESFIHSTMEKSSTQQHINNRQQLLSKKIGVTAFMVWFIENYPESAKIIKENPDYQYKFK